VIYFNLALAIIRLLSKIMERSQQMHWINEGERRLAAAQLKEANDALIQAAGVAKEYSALTAEALEKRIEKEGWYRD
jgi:hypothetical protein